VSAYVGSSKNLKDLKKDLTEMLAEQVPVSAYVGSSKNLKDLKELEEPKGPTGREGKEGPGGAINTSQRERVLY